tara:strand:- start:3243 stop:4046 length:804 start_codon:yes stop_codon:yes gene_type:complete
MEEISFRKYDDERIKEHYCKLRKNQTLSYVLKMKKKYLIFDTKIELWEAFNLLENYIDISDPDINLPNIYHLFQTAESIRNDNLPEWLQLTGLIHDLGKIIYKKNISCDIDGTSVSEQWGIVGDTFITGCKIPSTCVYPEFNNLLSIYIPDIEKTKMGIYTKNCGLENCHCSFGHDEYLYHLLKFNNCTLPEEAYYIIRYHSLYPWHTEGEYKHLTNDKDEKMLYWVKLFNKYDLYTKKDIKSDLNSLKKYYENIFKKYFKYNYIYY